MKIPFLDLRNENLAQIDDFQNALKITLLNGNLILGDEVEKFEIDFAKFNDTKYCVSVGNGLDALFLLLKAYGIGSGDEVLVPSNTFIATWLAVTRTGAKPIPVDPNPNTFNIHPDNILNLISPKTVAIIPVHLYGLSSDMNSINSIAEKYGLIVIEDAAQAHGALYYNKKAGSLGNSAATSFYPGKNLGGLGDGGAVLTDNFDIANKVRRLRNYGSIKKYEHDVIGYNTRLDEIQAAFLNIKLNKLTINNSLRSIIANLYLENIKSSFLTLPIVPYGYTHVWHLFVVRTKYRNYLKEYLSQHGISTLIHYPKPPHLQDCFSEYINNNLPIAESLANEVLSLPIYPTLEIDKVHYIIDVINKFKL